MELRANVPSGPLEKKWDQHRFDMKLVNPANKRKYSVLVVGTGLAGASAAVTLALENRAARPARYRRLGYAASDYASRTMIWSGPLLAAFIVYHLLHFTVGSVHHDFVAGDVYHNVVSGFRVWPVAGFYIACMLALGLHMVHGVWSMLQTLGLEHPRYNAWRRVVAAFFTLVVVIGNISIPVAVLTGVVR